MNSFVDTTNILSIFGMNKKWTPSRDIYYATNMIDINCLSTDNFLQEVRY